MKLSTSVVAVTFATTILAATAVEVEDGGLRKLRRNNRDSWYGSDWPRPTSPTSKVDTTTSTAKEVDATSTTTISTNNISNEEVNRSVVDATTTKAEANRIAQSTRKTNVKYDDDICPIYIKEHQPIAGRTGDYCVRGAACQTQYDPARHERTKGMVGVSLESKLGMQRKFIIDNHLSHESLKILDFSFEGVCTYYPAHMYDTSSLKKQHDYYEVPDSPENKAAPETLTYEPIGSSVGPEGASSTTSTTNENDGGYTFSVIEYVEESRQDDGGRKLYDYEAGSGAACFFSICLNHGAESIAFHFASHQNPYQHDFIDLCKCILSGGTYCDAACNCIEGHSYPTLPGSNTFCDCYCACC